MIEECVFCNNIFLILLGDEVLQWNGVPLQGRSPEEVALVVANSKHDSHVELVVSRPLVAGRTPPQAWRTHKGLYAFAVNTQSHNYEI